MRRGGGEGGEGWGCYSSAEGREAAGSEPAAACARYLSLSHTEILVYASSYEPKGGKGRSGRPGPPQASRPAGPPPPFWGTSRPYGEGSGRLSRFCVSQTERLRQRWERLSDGLAQDSAYLFKKWK